MADYYEKYDFEKQTIDIDGKEYQVFTKKKIHLDSSAPRLLVVSYQPNSESIDLIKLCVNTIREFTHIPYELWVIDNNSPLKNIEWLHAVDNINLVLNRTNPKEKWNDYSFANAIALEIGIRLIDQKSKYVMTLHGDTAVCKHDWLSFMLSKFDDNVKAVGVREDTGRVKEGILHVLGYIIDSQIFKELNLSFLPELPTYDVGDKAIVKLKPYFLNF